jgi:hypothetical protein
VRASHTVIYSIGLGANVDRELLTRLANDTGGDAYFPDEGQQLVGEYQRVLECLRRRYVISYTSTNATRDGGWRTVAVQTRTPHVSISSAGGFFAPEK